MKKLSAAVLALLMAPLITACGEVPTDGNLTGDTQSPAPNQQQNGENTSSADQNTDTDTGSDDNSGTVYSQKVTVLKTIEQFNSELTKKGIEYLADNEYVTIHENAYFFGLVDDVGFYIYPVQYTGDQAADISLEMGVFIPSDSKSTALLEDYTNCLLKANDSTLTDDTITSAMASAKELAELEGDSQYIDLENGLYLGYDTDFDGSIRYVVMRVYE